jgi:hypothetical protein
MENDRKNESGNIPISRLKKIVEETINQTRSVQETSRDLTDNFFELQLL